MFLLTGAIITFMLQSSATATAIIMVLVAMDYNLSTPSIEIREISNAENAEKAINISQSVYGVKQG